MKKIDGSTITLVIVSVVLVVFAIFAVVAITGSSKNVRSNENTEQNIDNTESNNYDNTNNVVENNNVPNESTQVPEIKKEFVEIASYKTKIYDTDENRIYNIKLACKRLDGHIIDSKKEFSFNNTMGSMGEADGYKEALGFDSNGEKIEVFGGGICQISSTLYNTVLIAKLDVTERHAHSRRVYYVPKNKDATVFSDGPDLKFINNTGERIKIRAKTNGYKVTVSLEQERII